MRDIVRHDDVGASPLSSDEESDGSDDEKSASSGSAASEGEEDGSETDGSEASGGAGGVHTSPPQKRQKTAWTLQTFPAGTQPHLANLSF